MTDLRAKHSWIRELRLTGGKTGKLDILLPLARFPTYKHTASLGNRMRPEILPKVTGLSSSRQGEPTTLRGAPTGQAPDLQ